MLTSCPGVRLGEVSSGVARAEVTDFSVRVHLTWDRFMRLSASANAFRQQRLSQAEQLSILDVGGFDGALALFLPECSVDVLDPATTGGDFFAVAADSYDVLFAVDVIEHVEPRQRAVFLAQMARVSRRMCVLNYPIPDSMTAQKLVASLTEDPFVAEHVMYGMPYTATVERHFEDCGFTCTSKRHTSRSLWATYMTLRANAQEPAKLVGRYLIEEHVHEEVPDPLYETLVAVRS